MTLSSNPVGASGGADAPMTDVAAICAGLTPEEKEALTGLGERWAAGPVLPETVADHLYDLRMAGLVDRHFADMSEPQMSQSATALSFRIGACWFFSLTPLGLAVRSALMKDKAL